MQRIPDGKSTLSSSVLMFTVAMSFLVVGIIYPEIAVRGQYGPPPSVQSTPTPTPTPVFTPPPPPPPAPYPTGITLPTDVTPVNTPNTFAVDQLTGQPTRDAALQGIHLVNDNSFPQLADLKGPTDWILVHPQTGCDFVRLSPYAIELKEGNALFSVKHPSHVGIVKVPLGEIAVSADGDVLISFVNNVLRVFNLDGRGETVKVKLDKGPFGTPVTDPTVSIAPGFELVSSFNKLVRKDLKPADGIARRNFKVLENGYLAISEFSVESALQSSELIASMSQRTSDAREKRILRDMSKMAAVLNHLNGTAGYTAAAKAQ